MDFSTHLKNEKSGSIVFVQTVNSYFLLPVIDCFLFLMFSNTFPPPRFWVHWLIKWRGRGVDTLTLPPPPVLIGNTTETIVFIILFKLYFSPLKQSISHLFGLCFCQCNSLLFIFKKHLCYLFLLFPPKNVRHLWGEGKCTLKKM